MLQATDKMREWAVKRWGSLDPSGPGALLVERGWKQVENGVWKRPVFGAKDEEDRAFQFLCDEWDHRGAW